ncbi:MAG: hypothetical protein M1559_03595 [Candidatus Marsarchaeota archaeon]|jgi:hypothetical protein|nr:hypothetical protein [Candidatus Marsarchaeota archaeon]
MPKKSLSKDTALPNAAAEASTEATRAKLLNATDSEIPFMALCANRGIKSFVIVSHPSEEELKRTEEPLNAAKKLIIPLRDDVSGNPASIGKLVNEEIRINGFDSGKVILSVRTIGSA